MNTRIKANKLQTGDLILIEGILVKIGTVYSYIDINGMAVTSFTIIATYADSSLTGKLCTYNQHAGFELIKGGNDNAESK